MALAGGSVHVIGAGAVGVSTALYLQREGFDVTLIDRDGPGNGCSAGNAGNIGIASFIPPATPGIWRHAWKMWMDPMHPLDIRLSHLPKSLPWFLRFALSSRKSRFLEVSDALAGIMRYAFDAYEPLLRAAGNEALIQRDGRLFVYETEAAFRNAQGSQERRQAKGIEVQALSGDEVREIEPALGPSVRFGHFLPEGGISINPQHMIQVLARSLEQSGGTIMRDVVTGFEVGSDGPRRILTEGGGCDVETVVVAAGAFSGALAKQLGTSVPLESERGYHVMIPDAGLGMRIPVGLSERHVVITPMEHGIRFTTGSEFSGLDAPPRWDLSLRILDDARALLPGLTGEVDSKWYGHRPATPDGLPVIGRSPVHRNVYFAFGHGHVGLGTGAITGRLMAQLMAGKPTEVDLTPFRAERF